MTFTLGAVIAGNALPAPLLPAYRAAWHLTQLTTTLIFAVYAVGVVAAVVLVGRLADEVGPRPVLVASIAIAAIGAAIALSANGVVWLYTARVVHGSAALLAGAAAVAAITQVSRDPRKAAGLAAVGTIGGIAFGLLLAGAVAELGGATLRWPWLAYLLLLCLAAAATLPLEGSLHRASRPRLTVALPALPPREVPAFLRAVAGASLAFACVGLLAGLGPSIALAIGVHDVLAGAAIAALTYVVSGSTLVALGDRMRSAIPGLFVLLSGLVLLLVAVETANAAWLLAGAAAIGAGNGLTFRLTLATANGLAPDRQRASIASTYNIAMYGAIAIALIGTAILAGATSLPSATAIVAAIVACATVVLIALEQAAANALRKDLRSPRPQRQE